MRMVFAAGAAALTLCGFSAPAMAEETAVIHRDRAPGIAVEHREGVVAHRDITARSVDCSSKTVHEEDGMGHSTTVLKEGCK